MSRIVRWRAPALLAGVRCRPLVSLRQAPFRATSTDASSWPSLAPMPAGEPHRLSALVAEKLRLPRFAASSASVLRIETPRQFYGLLKTKILQAKHRIFLSTLYVGKEERELARYLFEALSKRPELQVTILMDAMRATRESPRHVSSASLLVHLAAMFPDQVDIRLYATPILRPNSLKARMIGKRFNEGFGLQHMKIYGFDDDVIISGANLSRDYFTRRKDRYMMVRSHAFLADYLHSLILLISRFSYALRYRGDAQELAAMKNVLPTLDDDADEVTALCQSPFDLEWDGGGNLLAAEDTDGTVSATGLWPEWHTFPERNWAEPAAKALDEFTERWYERTQNTHSAPPQHAPPEKVDTYFVPLLQMGQLKVTQEAQMIPYLGQYLGALRAEPPTPDGRPYATVDITSGYFSLAGVYKSLVLSQELHSAAAQPGRVPVAFRLVAASPEANGFFGSKGVSGRIPGAYTYLEKQFWEQVVDRGLDKPLPGQDTPTVELREWRKYGWTYHQKGVWITPPGTPLPTTTLIGSSNYGARSEKFDLECSLLMTTDSLALRKLLANEVEDLRDDARDLMDMKAFDAKDRRVDSITRFLTRLVKYML
ncbi:CDP-diacylglycerol--glycerol-3-phosphate 1-phosphatidyltransferase [Malassezia japonica]|uniref:CDP-diacylglycerol--glycerol-3-phosphate 3-phosphatidyltransferase n=1 Tax=Malassezia japonica TaxID=223818 RepID=A0AAF0F4R4_9BASI|nr:CDP-diacylglycerol--glycerol-3-phosphate 1-phosphatidyltransferase [Malassezia japonica]WFD40539.1 CDP-diacylglycerol--glycerol-3-phosphate 1-phosphatidyltransferase [Malassezia japonica]